MHRFIVILILLFMLPVIGFANEHDRYWDRMGTHICRQLNTATELYRKGDFKKARTEALMAYFKSYDSDVQPVLRPLLGSKPVIDREQQFRRFAQALSITHIEKQDVQIQANALCVSIVNDMRVLKINNTNPIQPFF